MELESDGSVDPARGLRPSAAAAPASSLVALGAIPSQNFCAIPAEMKLCFNKHNKARGRFKRRPQSLSSLMESEEYLTCGGGCPRPLLLAGLVRCGRDLFGGKKPNLQTRLDDNVSFTGIRFYPSKETGIKIPDVAAGAFLQWSARIQAKRSSESAHALASDHDGYFTEKTNFSFDYTRFRPDFPVTRSPSPGMPPSRWESGWVSLLRYSNARIPQHIAFVMDGNRRFARQRGDPPWSGHAEGFDALTRALEVCLDLGVRVVTVYAFSQENFSRPKEELDVLFTLASEKFKEFLDQESLVMRRGVVVDMWGRPEMLPPALREAAARVVRGTRDNAGGARLNVCFAYSGTDEMDTAASHLRAGLERGELTAEDVRCPDLLARASFLKDSPELELLIRTSGESRLSDFMQWHVGSARLKFLDILWPEVTGWSVLRAVLEWQWEARKDERPTSESAPELSSRALAFLEKLEREKREVWDRLAAESA